MKTNAVRTLFILALVALLAPLTVAAETSPSVSLTASADPVVLGGNVTLTATLAGISSAPDTEVRFERLQDPDSGLPVVAGTAGAVWGLQENGVLNSRMQSSITIDSTQFGIGSWPVRVHVIASDGTDLTSEIALNVSGQ